MSAIFDLHCDTLTAFMVPGRCPDTLNDPQSAFALCRLPQGQHWAQCCAVFVPDGLPEGDVFPFFHTHVENFRRQGAQFADRARICRTAGEAEAAWEQGKAALFLTVENGAVLGRDLGRVEALARAGVVMVTLTWNGENAIGSGSQTDRGLTAFGREAAGELIRHHILLDVSHLNDRGFWDLMEETDVPVAASHSNARALCPHRRNLTDDQARELARRGGPAPLPGRVREGPRAGAVFGGKTGPGGHGKDLVEKRPELFPQKYLIWRRIGGRSYGVGAPGIFRGVPGGQPH